MPNQIHLFPPALPYLAALALGLAATCQVQASPFTVLGVPVPMDTDNATTTAKVSSGGYLTPHAPPYDLALPSMTSDKWTIGTSLGAQIQVPPFQDGYNTLTPTLGSAATGATLGQDPHFPPAGNPRDILRLTWGDGNGLTNETGNDLAVFEQATSEAFAVRVHQESGTWSNWIYNLHTGVYDSGLDSTATLFDLASFGAGFTLINALEVTNLIDGDTVGTPLSGNLGFGQVVFKNEGTPAPYVPGRWSSSENKYVAFTAGKYDPDIQYLVGLHNIQGGVSNVISAFTAGSPLSSPAWAAPTETPEPPALVMLAVGLALIGAARRRTGPAAAPQAGPAR